MDALGFDLLKSLENEWAQDFLDPGDTWPFLIKGLKIFAHRQEDRPQRKHENMHL